MLLSLLLVEYLFKSLPAWVVTILTFSMLIGPSGPKNGKTHLRKGALWRLFL
jgi:hypothetical protein